MASVAFNPRQNHVFSIIFFKDTLSLTPAIHSSSHIFCPFVYHRVSIVIRQVRKRTHATPAEVVSRDHSTCQAVDSGVCREPGTGFCLSRSVDESVERKPKKNEGTTIKANDSARCGKTGVGSSSLWSADGSLKRKLKKSEGNVVCAVDTGMHREMGDGISSLWSRSEGEERKPKKVEGDRRNPMPSRSNREIASKYSSLTSREGGFDRKFKRNESSCFADEKVEMKYKRHRLLQKTVDSRSETSGGFSLLRSVDERVDGQINGPTVDAKMKRGFIKQKQTTRCSTESRSYGETGAGYSSMRSKDRSVDTKLENNNARPIVVEKLDKKKANKNKGDIAGVQLRIGLDMCSKRGDVIGAISLYDTASREGMEFGQYHYNVLLYLCSSAAVGVVQPAKSGSGGVSGCIFDKVGLTSELPNKNSVDSSENGDSNDQNTDTVKPGSLSIGSGGNFGGSCNDMESELRFSSRSSLDLSENGTAGRKNSDKMVSISSGFQVDSAKHNGKVSLNEVKQNPQFSSSTQYGIVNGLNYNKAESGSELLDGFTAVMEYDSENSKDVWNSKVENAARVSDDIKKYALERGFEIYERMCLEKVPLNEAALTSVARMAMAMGNGDRAFEMVKQMKASGINPRLRSYGPALFTFCNKGDIEKAFEVEKHMLECGVYPEEPELEALLRLSVEAGRGEKVYYLLHKLRTSTRQVSPSTADLIEKWFKSTAASRVGKRKLDGRLVSQAVEHGGGGWHGLGWLGRGKWTVRRATVGADGICMGCREKLATIDIDPIETENFAESVAAIARKREQNSSFQIFQKWLDYYGPFEAVVDAANVGLFSQRRFSLSRVNAVVNGIRQKLPSKKLPLIVVHNKRISGRKMTDSPNRQLIDKWKTADALYATPTGSNDDWYWLYAAIKFKCLTVTNDEMRDHIFQLLGNDFFPKWKERHQVHFSFCEGSPEFHMPPPCSVLIQESEKGHWHIPIVAEQESTRERMWLCVMRATSPLQIQELCGKSKGKPTLHDKECASADVQTGNQTKLLPSDVGVGENIHPSTQHPQRIYASSRKAVSSEFLAHHTVISKIVSAEMIGGCVIDFQI